MFTEAQVSVSPATVLEVKDGRVLLQLPQRQAWAVLALAFPFSPEVGDVLLAIGDEDVYVIGVIAGKGKTRLEAPGDLEIHARGQVRITGEAGVKVAAPRVEVEAEKLELIAREAFERFVDVYRFATGAVQHSAARIRTLVSGPYTLQAGNIVEQAEKDVRIDGRHINLG